MIVITRTRDQARTMQKVFFPYFLLLAVSRVNELDVRTNEYLTGKIFLSLINEVKRKFDVKLLSTADKFKFKLSDAEGITLYSFLMTFPIEPDQYYLLNMRQQLCDQIFHQLVEPMVLSDG